MPLLITPLVYLSKSSTAAIAFFLAYGFLLYFPVKNWIGRDWKRALIVIIPLVIGIIACVWYVVFKDAPTGQFERRLIVWRGGINYFLTKSPWFGGGLGSWNQHNLMTMQDNGIPAKWIWAHNEFIQVLTELGVLVGIPIWFYFKRFFKGLNFFIERHRIIFASMIALVLTAFFHFPLHSKFVGFSIVILALIEAVKGEENEKTLSRSRCC